MYTLTEEEKKAMYRDTPIPVPSLDILRRLLEVGKRDEIPSLLDAYFEDLIQVYSPQIQGKLREVYYDYSHVHPLPKLLNPISYILGRQYATGSLFIETEALAGLPEMRPVDGKSSARYKEWIYTSEQELRIENGWPIYNVLAVPDLLQDPLRKKLFFMHEVAGHLGQFLARYEQVGKEQLEKEVFSGGLVKLLEQTSAFIEKPLMDAIKQKDLKYKNYRAHNWFIDFIIRDSYAAFHERDLLEHISLQYRPEEITMDDNSAFLSRIPAEILEGIRALHIKTRLEGHKIISSITAENDSGKAAERS